ncbi:recombinase family protein [Cryobacterium sp. Y62]|uniref:recombinase family protein n=1 Tax=Cryobacterium sp. Y62 TaxID=2048284 RepID=UPI000CE4927B|nr:recombinase family protein [Cryobacterium sp. Y62]
MNTIIYVRQSLDRDGAGAAVERQLTECREFCKAKGWKVTTVLEDNDISATSGKRRPAFEALLVSNPGRIVVWHVDRLIRLSRELERVIDLGVNVHAVKSGHVDLSTPAGRAVAKTITAWAQYEGEQKGIRQVAANVQRANAGVWQFSNRPYGYERVGGKVQIVESEAIVLREAYNRYLSGESYYAVVEDFNARGTLTVTGKPWSITTLRARLRNPAYAGIREYKGEVVAEGDWEPIITREKWNEYTRLRTHRKTPHDWSNKTKYLLSGLALCAVCGGRMLARPDYPRKGVDRPPRIAYACTDKWCTQRDQERLDGLVEGVIIARFSRPDVLELMRVDQDIAPQQAEALVLRGRWDDLAELVADGTMRPAAVREQVATIQGKLARIQAVIDAARGGSTMTDLALAEDTASAWALLGLPQKRQVIASLMTVTVSKQKNTRVFDPEDVAIAWLS